MEWEKWTLFYILIELLSYMVFYHTYSILLISFPVGKTVLGLQAAVCKVRHLGQCRSECHSTYLS